MNQIQIRKHVLSEKLHENLKKHVHEYAEALEAYKKAVVVYHDALAEMARNTPTSMPYYDPPIKPSSYAHEYENAIEMLSYEAGDVVTITRENFKHFVQDDWQWKRTFTDTIGKNAGYL